jgi:DNA-directed RNA polymerase subunit K/omega
MGRFEFVVIAKLRAHQLNQGCLPRVDGVHLRAVTAQLEVALGYIGRVAMPIQRQDAIESDSERGELLQHLV